MMDTRAFLNQDKTWISASGREVEIESMSPDHAEMAAKWLMQNATGLILVVESGINASAAVGLDGVKEVLSLMAQNPRQWVTSTPLFRALNQVAKS